MISPTAMPRICLLIDDRIIDQSAPTVSNYDERPRLPGFNPAMGGSPLQGCIDREKPDEHCLMKAKVRWTDLPRSLLPGTPCC
jgi:hypothetical protein